MQLQDVVGPQVKLVEKDLRHGFVVVLPGVDQGELGAGNGVHHLAKARDLDEVGARADDDEKVHGFWSVGGLRLQCMKQFAVFSWASASRWKRSGAWRVLPARACWIWCAPRSSSMPQRSKPQDPNKRSRSLSRAPPAIKGRPVARWQSVLPGIVRRPVSLLFWRITKAWQGDIAWGILRRGRRPLRTATRRRVGFAPVRHEWHPEGAVEDQMPRPGGLGTGVVVPDGTPPWGISAAIQRPKEAKHKGPGFRRVSRSRTISGVIPIGNPTPLGSLSFPEDGGPRAR